MSIDTGAATEGAIPDGKEAKGRQEIDLETVHQEEGGQKVVQEAVPQEKGRETLRQEAGYQEAGHQPTGGTGTNHHADGFLMDRGRPAVDPRLKQR